MTLRRRIMPAVLPCLLLAAVASFFFFYRRTKATDVEIDGATPALFEGEAGNADPEGQKEGEGNSVEYLSQETVLGHMGTECYYVRYANIVSYSLVPGKGMVPTRTRYAAGIFPLIFKYGDGFIKTVVRDARCCAHYKATYFKIYQLSRDYRRTDWFKKHGDYDVIPEVPELCPVPRPAGGKEIPGNMLVGSS